MVGGESELGFYLIKLECSIVSRVYGLLMCMYPPSTWLIDGAIYMYTHTVDMVDGDRFTYARTAGPGLHLALNFL